MVSPVSRRRAVSHLRGRGFPRACACRCVGLSRTASRAEPKSRPDPFREDVVRLSKEHPRYGFRWIHDLLPGVNLKAGVHCHGSAVQRDLEWLFLVHGKPSRLISDNGPEFRSLKLSDGVEAGLIQPGSPWQNGRGESFLDKLRDELLNRELYTSCEGVQMALDEHMDYCSHMRPHRSLKGLAPSSFKAALTDTPQREKLTP